MNTPEVQRAQPEIEISTLLDRFQTSGLAFHSKNTKLAYSYNIRNLIKEAVSRGDNTLTQADISGYFDGYKSDSGRSRAYSALITFKRWLDSEGLSGIIVNSEEWHANVWESKKLAEANSKRKWLTAEQVDHLKEVSASNPRDSLLIRATLATGEPPRKVLQLEKSDFKQDTSGRAGVVVEDFFYPLDVPTLQTAVRLFENVNGEQLFANRNGIIISRELIRQRMSVYGKKLGIPGLTLTQVMRAGQRIGVKRRPV